jgi:hypothetical protein
MGGEEDGIGVSRLVESRQGSARPRIRSAICSLDMGMEASYDAVLGGAPVVCRGQSNQGSEAAKETSG